MGLEAAERLDTRHLSGSKVGGIYLSLREIEVETREEEEVGGTLLLPFAKVSVLRRTRKEKEAKCVHFNRSSHMELRTT